MSDLALLVGAAGFTAGSPLVKAVGDLAALRYADGIHDSLYRAAGRALTIAAAAPSMRCMDRVARRVAAGTPD